MEHQKTAVEWLVQQMGDKEYILWNDKPWWDELVKLIEQAKAMEKEQIIKTAQDNFHAGQDLANGYKIDWNSAEEYYNETFKSE